MSIFELYGIAAGVLSFAAISIYIVDILRGETQPSKVTWWVLSFLNFTLTASYYVSGARETIWIPASYALGFFIVALLSLWRGEGSWEKSDYLALGGGVLSLILWWLLNSAQAALLLLILTDFVGLMPTIVKTFKRPWTESKLSWSIATIASALNVAAIDNWIPSIYLYPIYVVVTNGIISSFIWLPFNQKNRRVHN